MLAAFRKRYGGPRTTNIGRELLTNETNALTAELGSRKQWFAFCFSFSCRLFLLSLTRLLSLGVANLQAPAVGVEAV